MHANVEYLSSGEVEALGYFQLLLMWHDNSNVVTERVITTVLKFYLIWMLAWILEHLTLSWIIVGGWGWGLNKMHQGENYQDFIKWGGGGGILGHSLVIIKWTWEVFFPKFGIWTLVHSSSWKFGLCFVYIFIADWNFLMKLCSSDPSFNRNILIYLYLKSKTSAHAQLHNYTLIHTLHKFHNMVSVGTTQWR